jgi:iron complex transport system permease protein
LGPARVFEGLTSSDDALARTVVWDLRLPRVLLAVLVGATLAVSGGLLQGVTRNPLADPHILGLTAGGGLAASIALRAASDFPDHLLAPVAFGGAVVGGTVVYLMSWRGGVSPLRLALAGVAMASLLTAGTTMVLVTSDLTTQAALSWLAGGLFGRGWDDLQMVFAFVGLVIPHLSRFVTGDDHRALLPLSAILGGSLVVYADTFARVVQAPVEIPLGIVTAAIGAPFLLYLVRAKT